MRGAAWAHRLWGRENRTPVLPGISLQHRNRPSQQLAVQQLHYQTLPAKSEETQQGRRQDGQHQGKINEPRKGRYRSPFSFLFLYLPEDMLPGSGEVLELEDPGIIPGEILFGIPRRSPETLEPPVLLEPGGQSFRDFTQQIL